MTLVRGDVKSRIGNWWLSDRYICRATDHTNVHGRLLAQIDQTNSGPKPEVGGHEFAQGFIIIPEYLIGPTICHAPSFCETGQLLPTDRLKCLLYTYHVSTYSEVWWAAVFQA